MNQFVGRKTWQYYREKLFIFPACSVIVANMTGLFITTLDHL